EVFVLGGVSLFEEMLPRADKLYLTTVHATIEGDAYFPEIDWADWKEVYSDRHEVDERHAYAFSMKRFVRTR
uniref:dihydrofolate reductase n=1 Tax=Persicitalea sp. TaxID=3100273 RepID=UPI003594402C